MTAIYSVPLWLHGLWDEVRERRAAAASPAASGRWRWVAAEAVLCGALLAIILVFRSRTSLDFIYFQF